MILAQYQKLLKQFLSFKSISTDLQYKPEIQKTVDWLTELFKQHNFEVKILQGKNTNPVILAHYKITNNEYPTILIYGHYDVQPAPKDGWDSDPFTLTERDKKYFGRGVVDNKGQILIHIAAVFELIKQQKLKYNIKFLIEGNEETSNADLKQLMVQNKQLLQTTYVMVSDGEINNATPTIETSLRGGFNMTVHLQTAANTVHSGIYGGAIPNPAHELAKIISLMYDEQQVVNIPGFYVKADEISKKEREENERASKDIGTLLHHNGIHALATEPGNDFYTQTGLRPTIQVTSLKAGYIGDGYMNIVPNEAVVKINCRTVASQKSHEVAARVQHFIEENTPDYAKIQVRIDGIHEAVKVDINSAIIQQTRKILEEIYGKSVVSKHVGGAIPFVADVKDLLKIDTILVPFGPDTCNMHGANENFDIDLVEKALKFSASFLSE